MQLEGFRRKLGTAENETRKKTNALAGVETLLHLRIFFPKNIRSPTMITNKDRGFSGVWSNSNRSPRMHDNIFWNIPRNWGPKLHATRHASSGGVFRPFHATIPVLWPRAQQDRGGGRSRNPCSNNFWLGPHNGSHCFRILGETRGFVSMRPF